MSALYPCGEQRLCGARGRGTRAGETAFDESNKGLILVVPESVPNGMRNGQGEEVADVLAKAFEHGEHAGRNGFVGAAEMEDEEQHEQFLFLGDRLRVEVGVG